MYLILLGIIQHPANATFCKGSDAVLNCSVLDNSTNNAANTTSWFINTNPPALVPSKVTNHFLGGDVVTSILTIDSVSLNDNGIGYFCVPAYRIRSYVGVVSVAGGWV